MTVAFRSSHRHEIKREDWIAVTIRRPNDSDNVDSVSIESGQHDPAECELPEKDTESPLDEFKGETLEGFIVDISTTGIKLRSSHSFSFHEILILEIPRGDSAESIFVTAEVRWTQPDRNVEETWSTGCIIADEFSADYINEIARKGVLDRRQSKRESTNEFAKSRVESMAKDHDITISDVSATGIGFLSPIHVESGKRIQIEFRDQDDDGRIERFTVRAIRSTEVEGGYFVGCKLLRGSTYKILGQAVAAKVRAATDYRRMVPALNLFGMVLLIFFIIRDLLRLC